MLGDLVLPVAVLEGGVRVLRANAVLAALGRPWRGELQAYRIA
jgi:hypothetical protein